MRNLSIKTKLILIISASTIAALVLGFIIEAGRNVETLKRNKLQEAAVIVQVVADYTASAMAFEDVDGATEILSRFSAIQGAQQAVLLDNNREIFSRFNLDSEKYGNNILDSPLGIGADGLLITKPVSHNNTSYGSLYVYFSLSELQSMIKSYVIDIIAIAILTVIVAIVIASSLQGIISQPILNLAKVAKQISDGNDYSTRVTPPNEDEVGLLYLAFNQMLEQIESRKSTLESTVRDLDNAVEKLTESNQSLERFAYICSHDLQEPVRMIQAFSQLLEEHLDSSLDEKGRYYMNFITDGATNAHALITGILRFSRIEQDTEKKELVDLNQICQSVSKSLNATLEDRSARFTWSQDLPSIRGVESQIYQVFLNLVNNGIKFNQSAQPQVHIQAKDLEPYWEIAFTDNGIGIDHEYFEQIFTIFTRLNARSDYPGTGLGLAICKKIIEKEGGLLELESEIGTGTTFIIKWPKQSE